MIIVSSGYVDWEWEVHTLSRYVDPALATLTDAGLL